MPDFKLKYQIVADAAKAKAEVKSLDKSLEGIGTRIGGLNPAALGAASGVAAIAGSVAAVTGAAATLGVALFNLTKEAADYGSEIYNASVKTGLSAETMSALKLSADRTGVSLDSVGTIVGRFSKVIGEAAQGSDEAKEKLTRLGIDPKAAINDLDGSLASVIKQIYNMKSPVERATAAQQLFGKAGTELLKVIDDTKGDLPGLIAEAKKLGLTLSNEDAAAADQFGDQMDVLRAQLRGVQFTIGRELMPTFLKMAEDVTGWLAENKGEIKSWGESLSYWLNFALADVKQFRAELGLFREDLKWVYTFGVFGNDSPERQRFEAMRQAALNTKAGISPRTQGAVDDEYQLWKQGRLPLGGKPRNYLEELPDAGKKKKPPRETDSEFRKFFEEQGFHVNRTFGGAINEGSLHPSGLAADISVKGKKIDEIFTLVIKALEKGYRLFDERVKRPGVKQTGPHLHFERGGSLKESGFLGAGYYGGPEQLEYLRSLDSERLGKTSGLKGFQDFTKGAAAAATDLEREIDAALRGLADEMIAQEQKASDDRLAIRRKEADIAIVMIEDMVDRGEMTEIESIQRIGQLRVDMLEEEKRELDGQIPTKENIQRLEEIGLEIDKQRLDNVKEENDYWQRIGDEIDRQNRSLEKRNQRPYQMKKRQPPPPGVLSTIEGGAGVQLPSLVDDQGHLLDQADFVKGVYADVADFAGGAIGSMVQGLADLGVQWLLTGEFSAAAALKMMASTALSIATQAGIKALFEVAEGYAALAVHDYPGAALHFTAAKIFGTVAAIAGAAGVGLALGARAAGGGGGGGGGRNGPDEQTYTGAGRNHEEPRPISRESEDAYLIGHREPAAAMVARAIEKLEKKIDSMRAGDVLVRGAAQRPGFMVQTVNKELGSNAGHANMMNRRLGMR